MNLNFSHHDHPLYGTFHDIFCDQVMNLKEEFKEAQGWVKESLNFDINKVVTILITIVIDFDKIITIIMIIIMMIIKDVRQASECFRLFTP